VSDLPSAASSSDSPATAPERRRWLPTLERMVQILGIATVLYYIASFAYEVGFFWEIGPVYLSAFSMADHITHAATLGVISVGGFLVGTAIYGFFLHITEGATGIATPEVTADDPPPMQPSPEVPSVMWLTAGLWAALLIGYAYMFVLPDLRFGLGPSSLFRTSALLLGAVFVYAASRREEEREQALRFSIVPLVLCAALLPSAAGEWAYEAAIEHRERIMLNLGGARIVDGSTVFVGANRLIVATDRGLYLLSEDGTLRIRIKG
jgi:hypothetical protein